MLDFLQFMFLILALIFIVVMILNVSYPITLNRILIRLLIVSTGFIRFLHMILSHFSLISVLTFIVWIGVIVIVWDFE